MRALIGLSLALALGGCREGLEVDRVRPRRGAKVKADYARLLADVVTDEGFVDYDRLAAGRDALEAYLGWLALPRPPGRPRHAHWLNAYNAFVLYGVLHNGRPASVKDVPSWVPVPGAGFFLTQTYRLDGEWISLHELEHELVRFRLIDFRDHAALNCASVSCPPLRSEPYEDLVIDQQLDDQMARWVDDPARGVWLDGDEVVFSAIFDWFGEDFHFQSVGEDLCTIAASYTRDDHRQRMLFERSAAGCPHRFADYDWSLNHRVKPTVATGDEVPPDVEGEAPAAPTR